MEALENQRILFWTRRLKASRQYKRQKSEEIEAMTLANIWKEYESEVENMMRFQKKDEKEELSLIKILDNSYIVDGVKISAKVEEQKGLGIYEFVLSYLYVALSSEYVYFINYKFVTLFLYRAAFYNILDLSESREHDTIKSRFSFQLWRKLQSNMCMDKFVLLNEVEDWLSKLDKKSIESLEEALFQLRVTIRQTQQPLKIDLLYVLWTYENFVKKMTKVPSPLLDNDMSENTLLTLIIAPALQDLAKHGDVNIFKKMKVFGLQVFSWKAYIYALDMPHKHLYRFENMISFDIPRLPKDLLSLPLMIHSLMSLKEITISSIRISRQLKLTPESPPSLFISKTLDTPEKPKKFKHPAQ
ncbi:hypothetical protein G9A89_002352 [Geosiphon pyriformis]|nr:hypothetical protein G9A89_002352 [Geosiphon pyriformis]